ncbi:heme exporter protein CcmD [Marinobacter sp. X15-166B]|uniref:heme exporter protein CcmD n=1 Tax=Marinobacter sp. X15-166B TaxID=1897620 RepID=UPI00085BF2F4|nr:heme exporter protein CcmD [Marinobacter sp. X15-166B]OEY67098.1 heme exporter protein CcmD [Marinobacter sp. X15-166B]
MQFDSFAAFLFMEGHGPYVWTCYAVFTLALVGLAWWSLKQRTAVIRQQYHAQLRAERRQASADAHTATDGSGTPAASFSRIHPS